MVPVNARMVPGEPPLTAFVSSVMNKDVEDLERAREIVVDVMSAPPMFVPWAFEFTPASSEAPSEVYERKVRESDLLIWLVGAETTDAVRDEVLIAIAHEIPILAFKLPTVTRSAATDELIGRAQPRAKWTEVRDEGLAQAVEAAVAEELIRSFRGRPGIYHLVRCGELLRRSRSRCVARWVAAGVDPSVAVELVDDPTLVTEAVPNERPAAGMVVVVAEMGTGKSLYAERTFHKAIEAFASDRWDRVPVYVQARELGTSSLESEVQHQISALDATTQQGAFIVVDGVDEPGGGKELGLFAEAEGLVATHPDAHVLITSRSLPDATPTPTPSKQLRELTDEEASALVDRLVGHSSHVTWQWPPLIREAVRRPVFACLLASRLREGGDVPATTADLVRGLVERALASSRTRWAGAAAALERLTQLQLDFDGPVSRWEIARDAAEYASLIDSGLVLAHEDTLSIPLEILVGWFAADCLRHQRELVDAVVTEARRLERWRYAISLLIATDTAEGAGRVLDAVAARRPALLPSIVRDAVNTWSAHSSQADALRDGTSLRSSAQAIFDGMGRVGPWLFPSTGQQLASLGVAAHGSKLEYGWYADGVPRDPVVVIPPGTGWPDEIDRWHLTDVQGSAIWGWSQAIDEARGSIDRWLKRSWYDGPDVLASEALWDFCLCALGKGSMYPFPIKVGEVLDRLAPYSDVHTLRIGSRGFFSRRELDHYAESLESLRPSAESELNPPWPSPDRDRPGGGWVWDVYSPEHLLERVQAVYAAALEGYEGIVEEWLPALAEGMRTYVTLPATLVGRLRVLDDGSASGPVLWWYLKALDSSSRSTVEIELGDEPLWPDLGDLAAELRRLRPGCLGLIGAGSHGDGMTDLYDSMPVTSLVRRWLRYDLHALDWAKAL